MRKFSVLLLLSAAVLGSPAWPAADSRAPYERCVVGLNVTFQAWDQDRPWAKKKPENRRAYGVLVAENRVLTTADILERATLVQVEAMGRSRQGLPKIIRLDRTVNLALLSIEDVRVTGLEPAQVAARTPSSGTLRTVRWRGQQLEAAASRVIRFSVERTETGLTHHAFLRMRTDMAGGGWSEPVFDDGALVGLTVAQNGDESRAIPAEIIDAFLRRDAASGQPPGFTTLGVNWQLNEEDAVRGYLGLTGEPRGIVIRQVPWGSSGCGVLKPRDILLEIDGEPLDAEGNYAHRWLGRIGFNHLLAERFSPGQTVKLRVHRDGREQELSMTARTYPSGLEFIPMHQEAPPPYLIAGGLVVRELDVPYLRTWGKEWAKDAPDRLLSRYYFHGGNQTRELRRSVLVSSVLPAAYNIGYHDLRDVVIERINGRTIGRIEDVAEALEAPVKDVHVFNLATESVISQIVLDAGSFAEATAAIVKEYGIPSARRPRAEPLPEGAGDCPGDY